jgi:hypothetical protein
VACDDHTFKLICNAMVTGYALGILIVAGLWVAEGVRRFHQSAWFQRVLNR